MDTVKSVLAASLTYLEESALRDLHAQAARVEAEGIEGIILEAGCALGGSAIVITDAKSPSRPLRLYDVFGLIPSPTERDGRDIHERYHVIRSGKSGGIGGNKYYGYEENLYDLVIQNFLHHGYPIEENCVQLVKGLYQDTLNIDESVALAHIDCDWYESVMTCLERIVPRLSRGGCLVIDDYDAWSGCKDAVNEFFHNKADDYLFTRKSRVHIVRK